MSFARASAVRRLDDATWQAEVPPGWDIMGNANGGYLLAVLGRAMGDATGRPDPVTITGHYLAPVHAGTVTVTVDVLRVGRRFATASAAMHADGRRCVQALGTFGELSADGGGVERVEAAPPSLPPPQRCVAVVATTTFPPPFMDQVELRLHPDDAGFFGGEASGDLRIRGWFRLPGGEPVDTLALVMATDAFPPTAFNGRLPVAWVPTVELTAHVRARPAGGWLACGFSTRFVTGGFLEVDGELWDGAGRLVAQSRQLALVPRA